MNDGKPVTGKVIHGAGRGKGLGYPTANLDTDPSLLPESGVYAVWLLIEDDDTPYMGAANIGTNPTFGAHALGLEVHILGYSGDLYGRKIELFPVARIRPELKYENEATLVEQIKKDIIQIRAILQSEERQ